MGSVILGSVLWYKYKRRRTEEIKASVSTEFGFDNPTYERNENHLKEESIQLDDNLWNTEGGEWHPGIQEYTSLDDEYLHDAILHPPVAPAPGIARQAIVINVTLCPYKGEWTKCIQANHTEIF